MQSKLKFFSMLVIVISMMCFGPTAFGAKEMFITYVDDVKANISEPEKGAKPSFELNIQSPTDKVELNNSFDNSINGIIWIDETDNNKQLTENDSFKAGHQYRVSISLKTKKSSIRFKKNDSKLDMTITLNDNIISYAYAENGSSTIIVFEYGFRKLPEDKTNGKTPITEIEATSNYEDIAYMYGKVDTPECEVTNNVPVQIKDMIWEKTNGTGSNVNDLKPDDKNWKELSGGQYFTSGFVRLRCNLRIDGELGKKYYLSENATLKVDGQFWTLSDFRIEDDFSFCYATSPAFQPIEREEAKEFTVYFDTKGGNKIEPQTNKKYGEWIVRPEDPVRDGYSFLGWYQEEDYGNIVVFADASNNNTAIKGDTTIYAKWEKSKEEQPTQTETPTEQPALTEQPKTEIKYEVEFESNGGSKVATQEVAEKGKATKPNNPTKDGYTFDGWYADKKLTKAYDFSKEVTDDIILYAKWMEVKKEEQPTEQPTETPEKEENVRTWTKASEWAEEELDKANKMEIIPNKLKYADLTWNITRAEFAHVAVKLYEKLTGNKAIAIANNPFIDTADSEVLKAYNLEITKGTSEVTFNPDALITREQMATMMTRALNKAGIDTSVALDKVTKFVDDNEMHTWGRDSIYFMSEAGIIKGISTVENKYGVTGNATREQSLLISERSADKFSRAK